MDRLKLLLVLLIFCTSACSKEKVRGRNSKNEDQTVDDNTLRRLNETQEDLFSAVRETFEGGQFALPTGRKAQKGMKKALKPDGKPSPCDIGWQRSSEDLTEDIYVRDKIKLGACPIELYRTWTQIEGESPRWDFNQRIYIRSGKFREFTPITVYHARGDLEVVNVDGVQMVNAWLYPTQLKVEGYDDIDIRISVSSKTQGKRIGQGFVSVVIRVDGLISKASVSWNQLPPDKPTYKIDGRIIDDPKAFRERFSAYGLEEIMYRAIELAETMR